MEVLLSNSTSSTNTNISNSTSNSTSNDRINSNNSSGNSGVTTVLVLNKSPNNSNNILHKDSISSNKYIDGIAIDNTKLQFQTVSVIGKGGSSTVYKSKIINSSSSDSNDDGYIAIKQIDTDGLSKDQINGIKAEIETMKALSHPNIVSYLGTQQEPHKILIMLEYADGGSLRQYYYDNGALSETQVSYCLKHILSGLFYLHSNGLAHRDIKCANCLISVNGVVKLADFGASKRMESESIVSGLKGTPNFMAPEVIKGTQMTTGWMKADVWSLGCTTVEMINGKIPYSEYQNPMTAMYKIANGELPPIKQENISNELRSFVTVCCSLEPNERPLVESLLDHPYVKLDTTGVTLLPKVPEIVTVTSPTEAVGIACSSEGDTLSNAITSPVVVKPGEPPRHEMSSTSKRAQMKDVSQKKKSKMNILVSPDTCSDSESVNSRTTTPLVFLNTVGEQFKTSNESDISEMATPQLIHDHNRSRTYSIESSDTPTQPLSAGSINTISRFTPAGDASSQGAKFNFADFDEKASNIVHLADVSKEINTGEIPARINTSSSVSSRAGTTDLNRSPRRRALKQLTKKQCDDENLIAPVAPTSNRIEIYLESTTKQSDSMGNPSTDQMFDEINMSDTFEQSNSQKVLKKSIRKENVSIEKQNCSEEKLDGERPYAPLSGEKLRLHDPIDFNSSEIDSLQQINSSDSKSLPNSLLDSRQLSSSRNLNKVSKIGSINSTGGSINALNSSGRLNKSGKIDKSGKFNGERSLKRNKKTSKSRNSTLNVTANGMLLKETNGNQLKSNLDVSFNYRSKSAGLAAETDGINAKYKLPPMVAIKSGNLGDEGNEQGSDINGLSLRFIQSAPAVSNSISLPPIGQNRVRRLENKINTGFITSSTPDKLKPSQYFNYGKLSHSSSSAKNLPRLAPLFVDKTNEDTEK